MASFKLPPVPINVSEELKNEWSDFDDWHNYQKIIKRLGLRGDIARGDVDLLRVYHQTFCGAWNAERCDCNPRILNTLTGISYNLPNKKPDANH